MKADYRESEDELAYKPSCHSEYLAKQGSWYILAVACRTHYLKSEAESVADIAPVIIIFNQTLSCNLSHPYYLSENHPHHKEYQNDKRKRSLEESAAERKPFKSSQ